MKGPVQAGEPAGLRLLADDAGGALAERDEQPGVIGVDADAVGAPREALIGDELKNFGGDAEAEGLPTEA